MARSRRARDRFVAQGRAHPGLGFSGGCKDGFAARVVRLRRSAPTFLHSQDPPANPVILSKNLFSGSTRCKTSFSTPCPPRSQWLPSALLLLLLSSLHFTSGCPNLRNQLHEKARAPQAEFSRVFEKGGDILFRLIEIHRGKSLFQPSA